MAVEVDDTGRSEAWDPDEHDLGGAAKALKDDGEVWTTDLKLAVALLETIPGTSMEGRPGQWYRVYLTGGGVDDDGTFEPDR